MQKNQTNNLCYIGNIYNNNYNGGVTGLAGGVWDCEYLSPTLSSMQGGGRQPMIMLRGENKNKMTNYRIRKLTSTECWRLMGFEDKDIRKAEQVGVSNSSLYKQAGNSIITDCVELIAEHLYKSQYDNSFVCRDETDECLKPFRKDWLISKKRTM